MLSASYPDNEELRDLARLEWELRTVFDSADVPAWSLPDIARAGPQACFAQSPILHPSVRLLPMRTNAVAIWRAIDADDEVPAVVQREHPQALAVWRKGMRPHFKSLEPDEAQFLRELMCEGATIDAVAQAWDASQRMVDPALLGGWLAQWWTDELLQRGPTGGNVNYALP